MCARLFTPRARSLSQDAHAFDGGPAGLGDDASVSGAPPQDRPAGFKIQRTSRWGVESAHDQSDDGETAGEDGDDEAGGKDGGRVGDGDAEVG